MSDHEFFENGVRYVSSKAVAKIVGISSDYISRMCRRGHVISTFHGGTWYVHEASLARHLEDLHRRKKENFRALGERRKHEREQAEMHRRATEGVRLVVTTMPLIPRPLRSRADSPPLYAAAVAGVVLVSVAAAAFFL